MRKGWIVAIALVALFVIGSCNYATYTPKGWDKEKRHEFYTTTIGIWTIPYDWLKNLETPDSTGNPPKLFKDTFTMFGLIAPDSSDPKDTLNDLTYNPDRFLPIGFIKSSKTLDRSPVDPAIAGARLLNGVHYFGQTCASCHTAQLQYKDKRYRIDGGPGMLDALNFGGAMLRSVGATIKDQEKLKRLAANLKEKTPASPEELGAAMKILLGSFDSINPFLNEAYYKALYPTPWGFGRGDAFGRGGNTTLGALINNGECDKYNDVFKSNCEQYGNANRIKVEAPVSNPHIWNAWKYDRVQWNGSIGNPMGRNIAQAITTSRRLFFKNPVDLFLSDLNLHILHQIELLVWDLTPPPWPKDFDPIKPDLVAQSKERFAKGKTLYENLCAKCHVPTKLEAPNIFKQQWAVNMVDAKGIGTDLSMAQKFNQHPVKTGAIKGVLGKDEAEAVEVMQALTTGMMKRAKDKGEAPAGMFDEPNDWYNPMAYIARPNVGVWATPPFLHNGSVPNLYELLSPAEKRLPCFYVGNFEFDPEHVGYVTKKCDGPVHSNPRDFYDSNGFKFFTSIPGNFNTGHEYRDAPNCRQIQETKDSKEWAVDGVLGCKLGDNDIKAIIEYLKTCDSC